MPASRERTPREKETLIFSNPEGAQTFSERVTERVRSQNHPGIKRDREIMAEEVAAEFEAAGETISGIKQPWEHTPEEHNEVQALVNTAFTQDLKQALQQAKDSPNYPRNLDLLHDLLTSELYEHLRQRQLNRQPVGSWLLVVIIIILLTMIGVMLAFLL